MIKGFGEQANNFQKNDSANKLILKAFNFHNKGNLEEAKKLYNLLIKKKLWDPRVLTNLGVIYQQNNEYENAEIVFKESIARFPNFSLPFSNLGKIYLDKGNYHLAKLYLKKSIELNPKFLTAYKNLANTYINEEKLSDAEIILHKCIEINPRDFNSNLNLGCVLQNLGKFNESIPFLKNAIKISPKSTISYKNLAIVFEKLNKFNEAIQTYKNIITLEPNNSVNYINLTNILISKGDLLGAQEYIKEAIKIEPFSASPYTILGSISMDLDKFDEAEKLFYKSIELDEKYSFAYFSVLCLYEKANQIEKLESSLKAFKNKKFIKNEVHLYNSRLNFRLKNYQSSKKLIDEIDEKWVEKTEPIIQIQYWSFRAFIEEKVKNFDIAYNCFLKSQSNPKYKDCNPKVFQDYINLYRENINFKNHSKKATRLPINYKNPVFLIGFPRSGTTLLDTILRSHKDVDVIEEMPILNSLEKIIKEKYHYSLNEIYKLNNNEITFLRRHYLDELVKYSNKKNVDILIDKFPFQTVCLPLINLLFPNAKIIFTHRHPYDTVLSCFQQAFEPNNAMSNLISLESSAKIYDLTMNMWIDYKENLNIDYFESKYESLIDSFDEHVLKVLKFLNLQWDENIKGYRQTALKRGKINTPSSAQVVQPIYQTSIKKWHNYKKYFEGCNKYLDKWVNYFNY